MYCSKCGTQNDTNNNFCQKCGGVLEKNNFVNMSENNINNNYQPQQVTGYQPTEMKVESQNTFNSQQQNQNAASYNNNEKKSNKLGVVSLILGIISFLTSLVFLISIPTGVTGLILGIKSKVKNGVSKAGIVLSIIGLALTGLFIAIATLLPSSNTYYGDGYSLEYDRNWSITTLSGGQEAFQYQNEKSFLAPIGKSALSDSTSNFDTLSGQKELYQAFYDYWNNESSNSSTLKVFNGSNGFSELTDDIYYATYTYGVSATKIRGKYILLVSTEKNAVLSFMTNASENVEDNDRKALELLKNINIYEQTSTKPDNNSDDNVIYDDDLYNSLNSLRNWNRYSELRTGNLGKVKSINGGWRILSDSETYWKFENGQFWWYKSVNDLNDNYWYGTTQVLTGKAGLTVAGIDESKLDTIVSNSSGNVIVNDVYTIVCTPTKIISGGVDKSDTNIPEGTTWTYVWILVDHGAEGIEAQVLNTGNYDTSYYVKIAD